jgi:hypothetical protein
MIGRLVHSIKLSVIVQGFIRDRERAFKGPDFFRMCKIIKENGLFLFEFFISAKSEQKNKEMRAEICVL